MNKISFLLIFSCLFTLLNINLVLSLPSFYDGKPTNNSFTYGKDSDLFSINITDPNLDSSSVVHHIRVNEIGRNWTNSPTSCTSIGSGNWYCYNNSVSGFGSLGGDGTNFMFYFDAKNTTGSSNSSENYFVTIDRSAPQIFNNSFSNNSYISGNFNFLFTITDAYSGVNVASAKSMYGNTTFNSTFQSFSSTTPYSIYLDTRNFVNNSTYFIYVNVSDNIGNVNTTKFSVNIENELPTLSIVLPTTNSTMRGINYFQFTSTDSFSGINLNSAIYTLDSNSYPISCTGTSSSATCTSPLVNTSNFTDGFKTINFSITDNAGNTKWNATTFYIDNNAPSVSITYPSAGAAVRSSFPVVATVTDAGSGINLTQFRWENSSVGNWINMTCSGSNCTGTLASTSMTDGNYTLKVNATDNGGISTVQSIQIVVDNTNPNIVIVKPDVNQQISGNFLMNITITDNYGLGGNATFSAGNTSGTLVCAQRTNIQTFSCNGTINSSIFTDGIASLAFATNDLAGNTFSNSVNVSFDNFPPVITSISVDPPISRIAAKFKIKGVFTDAGSGVALATGRVTQPDGKTLPITFTKKETGWEVEYSASGNGKYLVDVILTDTNSHSATYTNATSFFIGISKCGDGICDPTENYCTCSQDCSAPTCKDYQTVKCKAGVPVCINKTGCGNDVCETGESCSTCESDCGKCGNQTGGWNLGTALGGGLMLVLVVVTLAVAAVLAYLFWPNKEKPVYPGFKPKQKPED
jgi:hypothetical protein